MTKQKIPLVLIQGDGASVLDGVDWTYLLEEMDVRDAIPLLQKLGRQMKPAANSSFLLVGEGEKDD